MIGILRRLSTRDNSILILTLTALACLPIALQKVLSDSALSLLFPVTILSAFTAYELASSGIRKIWALLILLFLGPLILYIRIAQVGNALFDAIHVSLKVASNIILSAQGSTHISLDLSNLLLAGNHLLSQSSGFGYRLYSWLAGIAQNKPGGDLAARAYVWSLGLWLIAAWASWQIRRYGKSLAGLTPATLLLGLILYNTSPHSGILWLYLTAFILIVGITNFENLVR